MAIHRTTGLATLTLNGKETLVRVVETNGMTVSDNEVISGVELVRNLKDNTGDQVTEMVTGAQQTVANGATVEVATLTTTNNVDEVISVTPETVAGFTITAERTGAHEITLSTTNDFGTSANFPETDFTVVYESEEGDDVAVRPTNVTGTVIVAYVDPEDSSNTLYNEIIVLKNGPQGGFNQSFAPGDHTAIYTNLAVNSIITQS